MCCFSSFALFGCGVGDLSLDKDLRTTFSYLINGMPDAPITRELVNTLPYASIAAKIGRRGPRGLLVLWRETTRDLLWLSVDNVAIVTRGGRVVQTAGLPYTIRGTKLLSSDPVDHKLHQIPSDTSFVREIDLVDGDTVNTVQIQSRFKVLGPRQIQITGLEFDTILVEELNQARRLNWTFTNRYWVDPADGFVWRSIQTIAREFGAIEIEVLKPAV